MSDEQSHNGGKPSKDASSSEESSAPEYRLVPVDEWQKSGTNGGGKNRYVDAKKLAGDTWQRRWFIAKVTGIFVIIGVLIALLSPVEYQTEATLLPERNRSSSSARGLIDQYGGLLGIGGGNLNLNRQESIPPKLYPEIVNSIPYQLELLNKPITFTTYDTTVTSYWFFKDIHSPSVFDYIEGYTLGLPGKILGLFSTKNPPEPLPLGFEADSIVTLTKGQTGVVNKMRDRITVELNDNDGTIQIITEMPDPNAAAQLGKISIQLLREHITSYRIQKASEDLEFTREQMENAKNEFEDVQLRLAEFEDQNIGNLTAKAQTREQQLQSEYDLTFNKYNSLAQQVEQAKLRVQEKTPVVTVLKPVQLPVDNSKPQRKFIVIVFLIIGFVLSAGYVVVKGLMAMQDSDSTHV